MRTTCGARSSGHAQWLAEPVPLEKLELAVMGAWTALVCVGAVVALGSGDWDKAERWALFGGFPALVFAGSLFRHRSGARARRLLALNDGIA